MKYTLVFIFLLTLFSCKKEAAEINTNTVTGKWNWVKSQGGIAGITTTPASTGKTVVLEFSNSTIKLFENGILKSEAPYTIQARNSIYGGQKEMIVVQSPSSIRSFEINAGTLFLNDECYDCFRSEYVRM